MVNPNTRCSEDRAVSRPPSPAAGGKGDSLEGERGHGEAAEEAKSPESTMGMRNRWVDLVTWCVN